MNELMQQAALGLLFASAHVAIHSCIMDGSTALASPPQSIVNGFQHEQPDYWLTFGNPWEIERPIVNYPIKFYGHVSTTTEDGRQVFKWNAGETVREGEPGEPG